MKLFYKTATTLLFSVSALATTASKQKGKTVLVMGAHTDTSKYANKAMKLLESYGHKAVPINPKFGEVLGKKSYQSASEWAKSTGERVDTVTLYMRAEHTDKIIDEIVALKPKRVIFNPGTENEKFKSALSKAGIEPVENCTLVMLNHGVF